MRVTEAMTVNFRKFLDCEILIERKEYVSGQNMQID